MKRACIAIVDAASARLYTYQDGDGTQEFIEEMDLVSAGRRAKDSEMFTESSPGSRGSLGARNGGAHGGLDDHRSAHREEMDARFVGQIVDELERLASVRGLGHIVFVTSARMLGMARPRLETLRKHGFRVDELERDLARLTRPQIHDRLAQLAVMEPRRRAMQPRR